MVINPKPVSESNKKTLKTVYYLDLTTLSKSRNVKCQQILITHLGTFNMFKLATKNWYNCNSAIKFQI